MKCPHCSVAFDEKFTDYNLKGDKEGTWHLLSATCDACEKFVFLLQSGQLKNGRFIPQKSFVVWPRSAAKPQFSPDVPKKIVNEYIEATAIIKDSPRASAALSRHCLQTILREVAKAKPSDLLDEISELLNSGTLPETLYHILDNIQIIAKFKAFPVKNLNTSEITPVELGEPEWMLQVVESMINFYYPQPEVVKKKGFSVLA